MYLLSGHKYKGAGKKYDICAMDLGSPVQSDHKIS